MFSKVHGRSQNHMFGLTMSHEHILYASPNQWPQYWQRVPGSGNLKELFGGVPIRL